MYYTGVNCTTCNIIKAKLKVKLFCARILLLNRSILGSFICIKYSIFGSFHVSGFWSLTSYSSSFVCLLENQENRRRGKGAMFYNKLSKFQSLWLWLTLRMSLFGLKGFPFVCASTKKKRRTNRVSFPDV